jgi:transcriptional regulator with XRE-family HTH domain
MAKHLTADQLADRLGVSPSTLADWRRLGSGPRFLIVGKLPRYRMKDVETWEESRLCLTTLQAYCKQQAEPRRKRKG